MTKEKALNLETGQIVYDKKSHHPWLVKGVVETTDMHYVGQKFKQGKKNIMVNVQMLDEHDYEPEYQNRWKRLSFTEFYFSPRQIEFEIVSV